MLSNIVNMWNYGLPDDVAPVMTETKVSLIASIIRKKNADSNLTHRKSCSINDTVQPV